MLVFPTCVVTKRFPIPERVPICKTTHIFGQLCPYSFLPSFELKVIRIRDVFLGHGRLAWESYKLNCCWGTVLDNSYMCSFISARMCIVFSMWLHLEERWLRPFASSVISLKYYRNSSTVAADLLLE